MLAFDGALALTFEANLAKTSFDLIGRSHSRLQLPNISRCSHGFVAYLFLTIYAYFQDAAYASECATAGSALDGQVYVGP